MRYNLGMSEKIELIYKLNDVDRTVAKRVKTQNKFKIV